MKIIISLLICCLLPIIAFAEAVDTIYLNDIKVTFTKRKLSTEPDILAVYLNKNNKQPSYQHQVLLDEKLLDAAIYNGRLTFLLKVRNTSHLLVFNQSNGQMIDNFWAIFASLSPDGRFVVYKKWQYRNEQSQFGRPDSVTSIYDVTKSRAENRTLIEQKQLRHAQSDLQSPYPKVGIPIYPLGDYNLPSYGWITNNSISHGVNDNYFWYQDDAFIFATYPRKGMTRLVNAVYDHKLSKFVVKVYKATTKDFTTGGLPEKKRLEINRVEKIGEHLKLFTKDAIIRLDNLNQLEQIE